MRILPTVVAGLLCFTALGAQAASQNGQVLQIVVSKDLQQMTVYDGLNVVAQSNISSGKPGHTTPSGIFSILEKRKFHRSNIYSNAPMPWMQRLTWSGIALHESNHVPNRPASHGCVRMPGDFAESLYELTSRGAHVIISDAPVAPQLLAGSALPKPRSLFPAATVTDAPLRASIGATDGESVEVAMNDPQPAITEQIEAENERSPVYMMITRTTERHKVAEVQKRLADLGFEPGDVDGILGKQTLGAIQAFRDQNMPETTGGMDPDFMAALSARDGKGEIANGQLMIRQNWKEIYTTGVTIRNPEKELGTHFLEARDVVPGDNEVKWYGLSLENHLGEAEAKRLGISQPIDALDNSPVRALSRIKMSDEAHDKIATLLGEGSSLTITDTGYQRETGLGTNFVTLTRKAPQNW